MDPRDRYAIAAEVGCSPRTVENWESGRTVAASTDYAIRAAAKKLGVTVPPAVTADAPSKEAS